MLSLIKKTKSLNLSYEWIQFMRSLGMMTDEEVKSEINPRIVASFKAGISDLDEDFFSKIYTPNKLFKNFDLKLGDISGSFDKAKIQAVGCLQVSNQEIQFKVSEYLKDEDRDMR